MSTFAAGIVAFSRILNDEEVIIVANTSTTDSRNDVEVIVDINLSRPGDVYKILYSNKPAPRSPGVVHGKAAGSVTVHEVDGGTGTGPLNAFGVSLDPMEFQILGK